MTTALAHTDTMLSSKEGDWLMACDTITGCNVVEGGQITYAIGAKFRVKFPCGDLLFCHDETAKTVTFIRHDLLAIEKMEDRT